MFLRRWSLIGHFAPRHAAGTNVGSGRKARQHRPTGEGPESGRKLAFQREPEIEFTARSGSSSRAIQPPESTPSGHCGSRPWRSHLGGSGLSRSAALESWPGQVLDRDRREGRGLRTLYYIPDGRLVINTPTAPCHERQTVASWEGTAGYRQYAVPFFPMRTVAHSVGGWLADLGPSLLG